MRLRPATPADYPTFTLLMPELRVDDPMPTEAAFVADLMPTMLIAEEDGPVGYIYYQVLAGVTYVRHVVVAPGARGRRVGERLMEAVAAIGREAGCTTWCLNVKPENTSAIKLYSRMGMRMVYPSTALRIDWSVIGLAIPTLPVVEADEARVEAATGITPGLLARWRGSRDRVSRFAELDGDVIAVAIYNPDFPGAFPFRVMRTGFGEGFLGAFRPWAKFEHVNVVVEDQPALRAELLSIGATVRLEIHHYRGAL